MEFRTYYGERKTFESNSGDRYMIEYQLIVNDEGLEVLEPCGQTDLQESIESYAQSVDINLILERYANGETEALDKVQGFFEDVSEMPVRLQDIMNVNKKGQEIFEQLPVKIKEAFDNDYMRFIANPEKLSRIMKEEADRQIEAILKDDVVVMEERKEPVKNDQQE